MQVSSMYRHAACNCIGKTATQESSSTPHLVTTAVQRRLQRKSTMTTAVQRRLQRKSPMARQAAHRLWRKGERLWRLVGIDF